MAYFDSEKNKAIWEKRLTELGREKTRRAENGYKPRPNESLMAVSENSIINIPMVRIITFEQLIEKEQRRHRLAMQQAKKARVAENTMSSPVKEQKVL